MIILHRQIIYEKCYAEFGKRWFYCRYGDLVHLCLGTVYAWSFFQKTVSETLVWNNSETAWAFSLAILCWVSLQLGRTKFTEIWAEKINVN